MIDNFCGLLVRDSPDGYHTMPVPEHGEFRGDEKGKCHITASVEDFK